jgi:hypothetical protein
MLPPHLYKEARERIRAAILSGQEDSDSVLRGNSVTLSLWVRTRKLIKLVGNTHRVLAHLGLDTAEWEAADGFWSGISYEVSVRTRAELFSEQLDVRDEAAIIAAAALPATTGLLEPHSTIVLGPDGEPWVIGHVVLPGGSVALRAIRRGHVVWEGLHELARWNTPPKTGSFRSSGRALLFAHERGLAAIDPSTGQLRWSIELPEALDRDKLGRPRLFDPFANDERGVLIARTDQQCLLAHDRETGAPRWRFDDHDGYAAHAFLIAGVGVGVSAREWCVALDGHTGRVLCAFGARHGGAPVRVQGVACDGVALLLSVRDWPHGTDNPQGVVAVDARTGQPTIPFVPVKVAAIISPVVWNERVYWASDDRQSVVVTRLVAAKRSSRWRAQPQPEPCTMVRVEQGDAIVQELAVAPDTVLVLLNGRLQSVARMIGLDAALLTIRFDVDLVDQHSSLNDKPLVVHKSLAIVATRRRWSGETAAQLRALDVSTGRTVWTLHADGLIEHAMVGAVLVIRSAQGTWFVEPTNGQRIDAFTG